MFLLNLFKIASIIPYIKIDKPKAFIVPKRILKELNPGIIKLMLKVIILINNPTIEINNPLFKLSLEK